MTKLTRCYVEPDCEREVTNVCPLCGRGVCDYHQDSSGLCIPCVPMETEADVIAFLTSEDERAELEYQRRMDA